MGLIGVFQVGTRMFFKGYFFSKNFREDSRLVVRKWKELKSWWFLWLFMLYCVSTWHFGKAGWLEVLFCKELPTFAQQWNRKREVCSIFWFWVVELKDIKRTFAPSEPYQPWLCPICGGWSVDHSGGSDESSKSHQSIAWDSFIQVSRGVSLHHELLKAINLYKLPCWHLSNSGVRCFKIQQRPCRKPCNLRLPRGPRWWLWP